MASLGSWRREFVSALSPTAGANGAGFLPCQGNYYYPARQRVTTAFIAAHYNVDFSEHYLGPELARRGFGFLGWNTRFRGNEAFFLLEHALIDIGVGVDWLLEQGVEQIVLLGNSGGGSLMAAYHSQALEPSMMPASGGQLPAALSELSPATHYVSLNAHQGRPEVLTSWFDPAVIDEADPMSVDPQLDMYNPDNGPPYTAAFCQGYRAAQRARNARISEWALRELVRCERLGYRDRAFNVYRTWADLRLLDAAIDPSERPIGVCYAGDPKAANYGPRGIGLTNTLRTWLSMWSLEHSFCSGRHHMHRIDLPSLVVQSRADCGVFPSDAKAIYASLGSSDKTLQFIDGDHYLQTPSGAREAAADLIADWLAPRL